jgi:hypothetical protein
MIALGKIFTLDNSRKMNVIVVEWCCMCKKCGESIDHLLIHCEVVTELWSAHFQLFGVAWVMPRRVSELLVSWRGQLGNRNALKIWRLAHLCIMWCLRREWNVRSFEDREKKLLEMKKKMLQSVYAWRVALNSLPFSNFSKFFGILFFFFYT